METTLAALIAYAVFGLTGGVRTAIILAMQDGVGKLTPAQFQELAMQGRWDGVAAIIACPPTVAVFWIAIRMARREFVEYLALNWPTRNELLLAFAVTAGVIVAHMALWPHGPPANAPFVAGGTGGLFVMLIGGCVAAPIMEEFAFRGFIFRGWSESFLGPIGAIVLTSALFGMNHTQYDWLERLWIVLFGLVLCTFRWRANSTWLTVVVHSGVNIFIFFLSGPYV
jgi:membrane protease YdiL (CAAX protease family)